MYGSGRYCPLDRKSFGRNLGLNVDIAKALGTLQWEFLLRALTQFGFHSTFIGYLS